MQNQENPSSKKDQHPSQFERSQEPAETMFNRLDKIMRIVFWFVFIWLIIRVFIFQIFKVPSASMYTTLKEGDHILVNKLAYGSRIPITPLSLPFGDTYLDWIQVPYFRLPGFAEVERNDIIVFNYPMDQTLPVDHRQEYVKRCIGLPGDTVQIRRGDVIVNHTDFSEPESFLPILRPQDSSDYSPIIFPNSSFVKWNASYFGPLYVPKKGESILLTKNNLTLYKNVIELHEKNKVRVVDNVVYINDLIRLNYVFKMDYFFVLGDNRRNSNDSRFWGFVPEDHLIGRVSE